MTDTNEPFSPSQSYTPQQQWHTYSVEETLARVQMDDTVAGVASADVDRRGKELGNNFLPTEGGKNIIIMFLSHFCNSITIILAVVAGVSAYLEDWGEFGVVIFVILFNGLLGFWQEHSAEKSIQGLKNLSEGSAKVVRDGQINVIPVSECVIGEIVVLEQGCTVPTDMRLFEVNNLEVDEALLTGEGDGIYKHADAIPDPEENLGLGDRKNMAYRYSTVLSGRGRGITVAGGRFTEVGKIAKRLTSDDGSGGKTPLQLKMERLMWVLFGMCGILIFLVFAANDWDGSGTTILYAAAVAIAILPESLVAVITVAMTISVRRMAQDKCIVRKLAALEVLGNVTDICSDKTGTLTENKMVAQVVVVGTDRVIDIIGEPLEPHAVFLEKKKQVVPSMLMQSADVEAYMTCSALCSSTHVYCTDGKLSFKGNPTEVAVQSLCWKAERPRQELEENGWTRRGEWSFDSQVKRMASGYVNPKGESLIFVKGAPDRVVALCTQKMEPSGKLSAMTEKDQAAIQDHIDALGARGLRCICLTQKPGDCGIDLNDKKLGDIPREDVEKDLVYLGLVGILDPPRPTSGPSVRLCQRAGIKVRMLTGDHTSTASAISKQLGIVGADLALETDVMMGPDFDKIDPEKRNAMVNLPSVIGRCSPDSKVNMVEALQSQGRIVAMTGDGFNDGPSIKRADVGCAMGSGTDVTKGVAELVITDDKFTTIVKAVAEGRRIASSISKFVVHLLSGNVAEVIVLILGLPIQLDNRSVFILSPIEILWLNMFTGSPPATGLSLDEADPDILEVPPNTRGFFTPELIADTFIYGAFLGGTALCSFVVVLYGFHDGPSGTYCNKPKAVDCKEIWTARSTCFTVLYLGLLLHAYNVRNTRKSIFRMKWFDNNWLWGSVAFGVVTLIPILYVPQIAKYVFVHEKLTWEWAVVAVALIIFMTLAELYKIIKNVAFPIKKVEVAPEFAITSEEEMEMTLPAHEDNRSLVEIAEQDLRKSFAHQRNHIPPNAEDTLGSETVDFNRTGSFVLRRGASFQGSA